MIATTPWEEAYQRFETPAEERRKFIRRLRRLGVHRWNRESTVIEVCSGRGNGMLAWQQLGFSRVLGVDLSPALVDSSACRPRSIVGDACRLPVRSSSHDVAIVQGGLHHLPSMDDVREALAEMHRVLKPDGRVIIIEPWMTPFLRGIVECPYAVSPIPKAQDLVEQLTEREVMVLALLPQHLSTAEIAERLDVSLNTVKTHLKHIYRKFGVANRSAAVDAAECIHIL